MSRRPCRPGHVRSRPPRWRCATSRQMDRSAVPRLAEAGLSRQPSNGCDEICHGTPEDRLPGRTKAGSGRCRGCGALPLVRVAGVGRHAGAPAAPCGSGRAAVPRPPSTHPLVHGGAGGRRLGGRMRVGTCTGPRPALSRVSRRQAAPRCAGDRPGDRSVGPRRGSSVEPARWCTGRPGRRGASTERSRAPSDRRRRGDGPRVLELRPWAASPLRAGRLRVRRLPARPRAAAGATG